jgi:hypothetical protein
MHAESNIKEIKDKRDVLYTTIIECFVRARKLTFLIPTFAAFAHRDRSLRRGIVIGGGGQQQPARRQHHDCWRK